VRFSHLPYPCGLEGRAAPESVDEVESARVVVANCVRRPYRVLRLVSWGSRSVRSLGRYETLDLFTARVPCPVEPDKSR
jgi:hypothetical protein